MKKMIFTAIVVLLALTLATCDFTPIGGTGDEIEYTNVVYSADGGSVTLYLEGGVPVTESQRALSASIAKAGHDFYEVVFVNDDDSVVARASWGRGENAAIRGIARGMDYGAVASASDGKAILFAGRRSDKTLLAVGTLTNADGGGTATTVDTNTTRVTFSIASLVGGFHESGSVTGGTLGTTEVTINGATYKTYNRLHLANSAAETVTYTISTNAGTFGTTYAPGIFVDAAGTVSLGVPSVMLADGVIKDFSNVVTLATTPTLTNNTTSATAFAPAIGFTLDTSGSIQGLFSLSFSIPVYAITKAAGTNDGVTSAVIWNIKPGFGIYQHELDEGTETSFGGAILLSVGADSEWIGITTINL